MKWNQFLLNILCLFILLCASLQQNAPTTATGCTPITTTASIAPNSIISPSFFRISTSAFTVSFSPSIDASTLGKMTLTCNSNPVITFTKAQQLNQPTAQQLSALAASQATAQQAIQNASAQIQAQSQATLQAAQAAAAQAISDQNTLIATQQAAIAATQVVTPVQAAVIVNPFALMELQMSLQVALQNYAIAQAYLNQLIAQINSQAARLLTVDPRIYTAQQNVQQALAQVNQLTALLQSMNQADVAPVAIVNNSALIAQQALDLAALKTTQNNTLIAAKAASDAVAARLAGILAALQAAALLNTTVVTLSATQIFNASADTSISVTGALSSCICKIYESSNTNSQTVETMLIKHPIPSRLTISGLSLLSVYINQQATNIYTITFDQLICLNCIRSITWKNGTLNYLTSSFTNDGTTKTSTFLAQFPSSGIWTASILFSDGTVTNTNLSVLASVLPTCTGISVAYVGSTSVYTVTVSFSSTPINNLTIGFTGKSVTNNSMTVSGSSLTFTTPDSNFPYGRYPVTLTDAFSPSNIFNCPNLIISTTMSIGAINLSLFAVSNPVAFTITFSQILNTKSLSKIASVTLTSATLGTVIPMIIGAAIGSNLQVSVTGLLEADLWTISAIDGNGSIITTNLKINVTEFISDFSPKSIAVNTDILINLTFINKLNTNIMTNISKVVLKDSAGILTPLLLGQVTGNTLQCSLPGGLNNVGFYDVVAYDTQTNPIYQAKLVKLVFTMKIISFTPALLLENTAFSITLVFGSLLNSGISFTAINSVNLISAQVGIVQNIPMSYKISNTNTLIIYSNLAIAGFYNIVILDKNLIQISTNAKINIIAIGSCLLDPNTGDSYKASYSKYFISNLLCVRTCPVGFLPDINLICIDGSATSSLISNGTAVVQCPPGQVLGTDSKNCVSCLSKGLFYSNNTCVAACPTGLGYNSQNICQYCGLAFPPSYLYINQCLPNCNPNQIVDNIAYTCVDCNKFIFKNTCVAICPYRYQALKGNVCTVCGALQYWYLNTCLDTCPVGYNNQLGFTCQLNLIDVAVTQSAVIKCTAGICNSGTCKINLKKVTCTCPLKTYGNNCEFTEKDIINVALTYSNLTANITLASNVSLSTSQSSALISYTTLIKQYPSLATTDTANKLADIATKQGIAMKQGLIPVDPALITVSDGTINALMTSYSKLPDVNKTAVNTLTLNSYVKSLKDSVDSVSQTLGATYNFTAAANVSLLYGGKYITTHIGVYNPEYTNTAKSSNLSIVMINSPSINNDQIIITKTETDPSITSIASQRMLQIGQNGPIFTNFTNSVKYSFIYASTRQSYNFTNTDTTFNVSMKIKSDANLNLTFYNTLYYQSIDIFNPNSTAFTSRCYAMQDPSNGWDTTINYRRLNYYQNLTAACSNGCTYLGIDTNSYLNCLCNLNTTTVAISSQFQVYQINTTSNVNLGLMYCTANIIQSNIKQNAGFFVMVGLIGFTVLLLYILWLFNVNSIKKHLSKIIYNDGFLMSQTDIIITNKTQNKKDILTVIDLKTARDIAFSPRSEIRDSDVSNIIFKNPKVILAVENDDLQKEAGKYFDKKESSEVKVYSKGSYNSEPVKETIYKNIKADSSNIGSNSQLTIFSLNPNKQLICNNNDDLNVLNHLPICDNPLDNDIIINSSHEKPDKNNIFKSFTVEQESFINENDKIGFFRYIFDYLSIEHILFSLFKKSLFEPYWIRCLFLIFSINIEFGLNAMLNSDDWVDKKAQFPDSIRVINK